jgi:hypothetical protein
MKYPFLYSFWSLGAKIRIIFEKGKCLGNKTTKQDMDFFMLRHCDNATICFLDLATWRRSSSGLAPA